MPDTNPGSIIPTESHMIWMMPVGPFSGALGLDVVRAH